LRFIDRRFGFRLSSPIVWAIALWLPLIVAIRTATVFHAISPDIGAPAELCAVALLALSCLQGTRRQKALGLLAGTSLGAGALWAPFNTMVIIAILHNLTPLGFLWQIAPRDRRATIMTVAMSLFIGLPMLVATGWPRVMLEKTFGTLPGVNPLGAAPLAEQFYVYVPEPFVAGASAIDLFTASVVAQSLHYASVIVILPLLLRRLDPAARSVFCWPRGIWFGALCTAGASLFLYRSFGHFAEARSLYGIIASLHAWIEIPILIAVFGGGVQSFIKNKPAASEAELVMNETNIARSRRKAAIQAMSRPSVRTTSASSVKIVGQ
jgi:hypothetical protein